MAHYVQVLNDLVVNMWDSPPKVPIGEDGWRNAVMDVPTINNEKQYLGNWTYDLTVDPVIISREVFNYTVEERKQILLEKNQNYFRTFVELSAKNPNLYSQEDTSNARNTASTNKTAIDSATTHEELDNLIIIPIDLF